MPPRRCFPRGSSEAAFCGIFQRRRCAQRRRSLLSFSPRRPAVLLSLPAARTTMPHEHIPVHANRRAVPTLFHIFPARPSRASSFTLPPGQRYRARSPKQCLPKGSSEAAFCGVLKRRRCAQRRRSLLSFSPPPPGRTSFFTQPPAIGCRARTPRRCFPMGSSKAAFCGILQGRRDDACRWARPRRLSAGFCRAAAAMLPVGLV